jgi:DUF4097 and DUF4098 domain-containing protein YvlB
MRNVLFLITAVLFLRADPGEQPGTLEQDGEYWVERTGGTIPAGDAPFLRIETRGSVIFQGDGGSSLGYQIVRRVQARSEAEARRMLQWAGTPKPVRTGDQLELAAKRGSRVTTDIRVQPPRQLRQVVVETDTGQVEVRDVRAPVNIENGGGPVLCDRLGGSLSVRSGGGDLIIGNINGPVRVSTASGMVKLRQAAGEATIETGGGEISVDEVTGTLYAATGAGSIDVGRAGGRVEAHARGGLVRVREAAGEVVAESGGGGILIGSARGVRCESTGGAVKLTGVTGQIQVRTIVGSIIAQLQAARPLLNSLLSAGRGDITVWIPADLAVTVAAIADSPRSRIVSEFREIPVGSLALDGELRCIARGSLNGGGPVLKVAAGDGVVYLRKQR